MRPTGFSAHGCDRPHYARTLCHNHWKRAWRAHRLDEHPRTSPVVDDTPLSERLAQRGWTVVPSGCWVLNGYRNPQGYVYMANDPTWSY